MDKKLDNALNNESKRQDFLWKQYYLWIELYKFYLDVAFKANAFFYAVTGGIITFYFSTPNKQYIRYALLLPAIMSAGFFYIAMYGIRAFNVTKKEVDLLALQLTLKEYPDLNVLTIALYVFACVFLLVSISMLCLIFQLVNI
ncbi:hypothetical protein AB0758_44630 [Tolypothrix bouteillei VB521301_2]|uniref:ABC transporter permease n=1 Tax=Tolypothrix bouteillei VB521301 TaxID=1479485 RepID=A0A0C1NFW2_9CYAN